MVLCSPPPRADLAKASGPLAGRASLNSSSSRPPSRPFLLNRPLQLSPRGQLKCLLELVSDSNHSSIQIPPPQHPTVLPALRLLSNPCITSPLSTELTTNFLKAGGSQTVIYNWSFCSLHEAEELVPKRKSIYFFILNFQKE